MVPRAGGSTSHTPLHVLEPVEDHLDLRGGGLARSSGLTLSCRDQANEALAIGMNVVASYSGGSGLNERSRQQRQEGEGEAGLFVDREFKWIAGQRSGRSASHFMPSPMLYTEPYGSV